MKKEQLISIIAQKLKDYDYEILTKNTDATYEMVAEEIVNEIINLGQEEKEKKERDHRQLIDEYSAEWTGKPVSRVEAIELLRKQIEKAEEERYAN